jgi:hypothetical protein
LALRLSQFEGHSCGYQLAGFINDDSINFDTTGQNKTTGLLPTRNQRLRDQERVQSLFGVFFDRKRRVLR